MSFTMPPHVAFYIEKRILFHERWMDGIRTLGCYVRASRTRALDQSLSQTYFHALTFLSCMKEFSHMKIHST